MGQIVFGISFEIVCCCKCSMHFAIPADFQANLRKTHDWFHCPLGHSQQYPGKTELDIEREKATAIQAKVNEERHARLVAEKALAEEKQELARLKNRAMHGVCLCCNRTFENLSEHMKSQHPAEIPGGERKGIAGADISKSVEDLELSCRAYNCLKNMGIETVGQLTSMTEHDLMRTKNFGKRSLTEIKDELARMGLQLRAGGRWLGK